MVNLLPLAFDLFKGKHLAQYFISTMYTCTKQQGSIDICVTPLVALMMDQNAKFTPKTIATKFVGEEQVQLLCTSALKASYVTDPPTYGK
jgi:ABC-type transport system involved in cytochrome c biogenesis permease component